MWSVKDVIAATTQLIHQLTRRAVATGDARGAQAARHQAKIVVTDEASAAAADATTAGACASLADVAYAKYDAHSCHGREHCRKYAHCDDDAATGSAAAAAAARSVVVLRCAL